MRRSLLSLTALTAAVLHPALAHARTEVHPYIEASQTFVANLKGGAEDVLTYTSLAAGVDATFQTARTEVRADARYEHQFGWGKRAPDSDILSGMLRGRYAVIPDKLSIEGGALATRVRTDGLSSANGGTLITAGDSVSQLYSLYAGPTLTTHVNDLSVNAAYRIGYTRIEDDVNLAVGGIPAFGVFDESVYQSATASVGMQPGPLPFGWAIGVGYDREDASELDQRYQDKWIRGDVTVPVSPTLALVGGVGYEDIIIDQRAALVDGAGNPVLDGKGRLISDTSVPRLIAYDTEGLIWDAGVLWRPSRRTSLEARVGERYDSMHYIGSFTWRASPHSLFQIAYFDRIDSFGRALHGNLVALPTDFIAARNPFSGDLTGCVSGQSGGTCLNNTLAAINGSNFRHRGIAAQYGWTGRRWNWGAAGGWSQRKFLAPRGSIFSTVNGAHSDYYYGQVFGGHKIDIASTLGASLYANYLDAPAGGIDVSNYGAYTTYNRQFGRHLSAQASLGLDALDTTAIETIVNLLGQVGVRYTF
ncbi:MAG: hypothetical protein KA533_00270 [Sphingobium sp.]|nr:hypothetical protein [Sphingobium sp.]MBP6111057.1 hypothetical protein [Sphingobium sp.]MBP8670175.1 hypothetical protein [Sphingobium sp.]MBP9157209.1 hypothetical protein [Sphingobium sp.]MCC6482190.1 hypothetical protein [Sphingomonadaceae bacterium]